MERAAPDVIHNAAQQRFESTIDGHLNVADYVLSNFAKAEQTEAEIMIKEAADAVEETVRRGPLLAMNKVNQREKQESE